MASTEQPRSSAAASASRIEKSSQRNSDRTRRRRAAPMTLRSAALRSAGSRTSRSLTPGWWLPSFGRRPGDILDALLALADQLRAQIFERIGGLQRGEVLGRRFVALRHFAGLEQDAIDGKHVV